MKDTKVDNKYTNMDKQNKGTGGERPYRQLKIKL